MMENVGLSGSKVRCFIPAPANIKPAFDVHVNALTKR